MNRRTRSHCQRWQWLLRNFPAVVLVVGAAAVPCGAHTTERSAPVARYSPEPVLRSAWMLRHPELPLPPPARTLAEEKTQLQNHFRMVEAILVADTCRSLAIATARLENASEKSWSTSERLRALYRLYTRRLTQISRLRIYAETGRFPLNLDAQAPSRPIFVDSQGTACAVGHLMLCSGASEQVATIASINRFVVVPDVTDGPLVDWILQSGLTQEEAALIQPTYGPPTHYEAIMSALLTSGGSLERDGVRYSNFTFSATPYGAPRYDPSLVHLITDLSDITAGPTPGFPDSKYFVPRGTNFLALHGELGSTRPDYGPDPTIKNNALLWHLGFDVTVIDPTMAINAAYMTSNQFHMLTIRGQQWGPTLFHAPDGSVFIPEPDEFGNPYSFDGYAKYQMDVSSGASSFGSTTLGGSSRLDFVAGTYLHGSHDVSFSPVQSLHVDTQLLLAGNAFSMDIAHEFQLVPVPEPSTWLLAILSLATLGLLGWRKVIAGRLADAH